jgi:hypothetical protein
VWLELAYEKITLLKDVPGHIFDILLHWFMPKNNIFYALF